MNITENETKRLVGHINYLIDNLMTFDNKDEFYEEYGQVITLLKNENYPYYDELYHTFTKEVEFARSSTSASEFNMPTRKSYLPVISSEMYKLKDWLMKELKSSDNNK